MHYKFALLVATLFMLVVENATAGLLGPSNYEECITESMKGVTSDVAARAIIAACRKRFPDKPSEASKNAYVVPYEVLSRLTGQANSIYVNSFSGSLYNGNPKITISEVTISVTTLFQKQKTTRSYIAAVHIPPMTTSSFGFQIIVDDPKNVDSWGIEAAKGYE